MKNKQKSNQPSDRLLRDLDRQLRSEQQKADRVLDLLGFPVEINSLSEVEDIITSIRPRIVC